jgi:hydroxymethylglutaryl-CoA reductase (NADPH)
MKISNFKNAGQRREFLEKELKVSLSNIACFSLAEEKIKNRNCENMIGTTQVPLGIAGPIKIKNHPPAGGSKIKNLYLPLATTEGALVASINRGCKATRLSGINVLVEEIGTTRGPVFRTKNIKQSLAFKNWLDQNFIKLQQEAGKTSSYLLLKKLDTSFCGRDVYVRFYFKTREAMGMNMVTMATQKLIQLIKAKTGIKCLALSGNFCIDKKAAWLNFISGRGKRVWAESVVKKEMVKKVLKTTPEKIVTVVKKKCHLGSMISGSLGFNGHYANIIAAIFLATGQDIAQVTEGALGITTAELEKNGDLYFSIYLTDLMVGTIGGGTHLETQKEALSILGLDQGKKGDSLRLAEIIGGAVLAGELSLLAALSVGQLAQAHQKLGRGK